MSKLHDNTEEAFVAFVRAVESGLRAALVARHGAERGWEATNDALTYGWQHWDRVRQMENPAGYLYRVGERRARRRRLRPAVPPDEPGRSDPWVEPGLAAALLALSNRQRQTVMLIEAYEYTFREAAELLGLSISSVQTHHERGLSRMRTALGVEADE
ncbi:MAG: sigma-70 region 4 domain-containing protein [Acidimicrobiia bacterium]